MKRASKHFLIKANRPLLRLLKPRGSGIRKSAQKSPRAVIKSDPGIGRRLPRSVTRVLFAKKQDVQHNSLRFNVSKATEAVANAVSKVIATGDEASIGCETMPGAPVDDKPDAERDILSSDIPELRIIT